MNIFTQAIIWTRKNLTLVGIATICIVYGILTYLVPPYYTWFEWHRNMMAIGVLLLGFITAPLGFFLLFVQTTWQYNAIIAMLYFAFAGVIAGKIIQTLWNNGRSARIALGIVFILNVCFGLFLLAWGDVLVTENPSLGCQKFVNPEQGFRIVTFEQIRALPGTHNFYLFTFDGGNTWKQIFMETNEQITESDCQTFQALNNDFLWVWSSYHLRTTQDGGLTWKQWDWECCAYRAVQKVNFQDEISGTMTVYPWNSSISELITSDGGKTWLPEK